MSIDSYIASQLNPEQTQAALYTTGNALILAGAGSGKTRTLTYKIAKLLFDKCVDPTHILAVTFTNKAANEMKERMLALSQEFVDRGLTNQRIKLYQLKWFGTFHSVFLKVLKEDIHHLGSYEKNFGVYDDSEAMSILKEVIASLKYPDKVDQNAIKKVISGYKNQGLTPTQAKSKATDATDERFTTIYEKYQSSLQKANCVDFDDILFLSYQLFTRYPEVRQKWSDQFEYMLVDEAQDTNHIQFELMRMLSKSHNNITLIGDDYQSIYGWRGAVMENFLRVAEFWPDVEIFKLQTNYRSKPHIVYAGNSIIGYNTRQYQKTIVPHREKAGKIRVLEFGDEYDEAVNIINLIKRLKNESISYSDFAILYRTNAQSQVFEQMLVSEGIPYKVFGGFKFFDRKEVKDILSYLKVLSNRHDSVSVKRIINVPSRKIGTTTVQKIDVIAAEGGISFYQVISDLNSFEIDISSSTKKSLSDFVALLEFLKSRSLKLSQLIKEIIDIVRYADYLEESEGKAIAEEKMENLQQLMNLADKYDGEQSIEEFLDDVSLLSSLDEDKDDSVKLMSVHSSKGLEFPVVFIVGLEEGTFPLSRAKLDPIELEEERRLMYVAVTRAKESLFLSYAERRTRWRGADSESMFQRPSRFVAEIPGEMLQVITLAGPTRKSSSLDVDDEVQHQLWGKGIVVEIWQQTAMVKFQRYGMKKVDAKMLKKL